MLYTILVLRPPPVLVYLSVERWPTMRAFLSLFLCFPLALARSHLPRRSPDALVGSDGSVSLVSAAWYAGWHSGDFPLSAVSWDKYTHLTYSFAYVLSSCILAHPEPASHLLGRRPPT